MGKWEYNTAITYEVGRLIENTKGERQMACSISFVSMTCAERMPSSRTCVWNGSAMRMLRGSKEPERV